MVGLRSRMRKTPAGKGCRSPNRFAGLQQSNLTMLRASEPGENGALICLQPAPATWMIFEMHRRLLQTRSASVPAGNDSAPPMCDHLHQKGATQGGAMA